ncbi:1-phosphatidylinositol 4,5-bisphosphate phosphodiesterase delta-4 [Coelomomyces lativittatus]|nr:1-phosphatidylinositol 4,5-bisphosphate phosphodiesterase delta-4 [Coelomomyces lativittatus]
MDAPIYDYQCSDVNFYDTTTFRTKIIQSNGWNPLWKESFSLIIKNPLLTILRFTVYDSDFNKDTFVASFSAPLSSLKFGYRHLQLRTWKGHPHSNATLFIYLRTQDLEAPPPSLSFTS